MNQDAVNGVALGVGQGAPARSYRRFIPDLREGETVVFLHRHHPAVLLPLLTIPVALLCAALASLILLLPVMRQLQDDAINPLSQGLPAWVPTLIWVAWLLVVAALVVWAAYRVLDWADDWIALTNRRILIMERKPLMRETRREIPIGRVQNITAEFPRSMGVALDFGDLKIDTAGIGVLSFDNVPRPKALREAIFTQQEAMVAREPSPEDRRAAVVRSIILGTDPSLHDQPTPPGGNPLLPEGAVSSPRADDTPSLFATLFPFAPQRAGASVTWHKHWLFLVRALVPPAFLWVLAMAAWIVSVVIDSQGQLGSMPVVLGWIAVAASPLCLLWGLWQWDDWRNDIYKVDHERLYDIERLPFGLREQSKETRITRVTDAIYVVPGPFARIFNYGDVILRTPGESTEFTFMRVPRPREVQQEIMDRIDQYQRKRDASSDREIESWLRSYHDARGQ